MLSYPQSLHSKHDQWNSFTDEQFYDIQEPIDILGDKNSVVIVLWITFPFYIPILNGTNDMRPADFSKLQLNYITTFFIR